MSTSTNKSDKEVLQQMINDLRKSVDKVEDQLKRFEKRKKDHKRKNRRNHNRMVTEFQRIQKSIQQRRPYLFVVSDNIFEPRIRGTGSRRSATYQRLADSASVIYHYNFFLQVEEEECTLKKNTNVRNSVICLSYASQLSYFFSYHVYNYTYFFFD